VELRILGPFEVCDDSGQPVKLPAGRERALLAVLALQRGEVVSTDVLVDALWGEQPPTTASKALQGYVSHLRRLLDSSGANGMLVTQPPGYALRVDESRIDARRFEVLAAEGWRTLDHDAAAAVATFEEALALWRGPVLGEFAFAEFAQREIHRLEELRLETVEGRIEGLLRLGRHGAVVAELEARVDEHPLRERLRGQLMLALYRCGRQAEALEVYRDGRALLAHELGLEPGTDLQRLERAILEQDPSLEAPERVPGPSSVVPPEPEGGGGRRRRRLRILIAGLVLLAVALAGVTVGYLLVRDEGPATVVVTPPALVVVDPASNRIVASIPLGSRPVTVAGGAGAVWVGDARDGTVTRIDPSAKAVSKTIGIGSPVVDLATGVGGVWAATGGFGDVIRIDPEIGAVARRSPLGDPGDPVVPAVSSVGAGDGRVWAGAFDGLVRLDPTSGEVIAQVDLGRANALQMAVGDGAVWATTIASRAKRVEARSAEVTTEFYAGSWVFPIALGGGAVWVGGANGQVWKLDPVTGSGLLTLRVVPDVSGVAFGDGSLWVTSAGRKELVRVNPSTGEVQARIALDGPAEDIAVHDGLVWIPVQRAS
jgi:DNA-binding SARP family transcriptional activator/streptogramin lyase